VKLISEGVKKRLEDVKLEFLEARVKEGVTSCEGI